MAVDSATLSTAAGILKEVYLPGIVNSVNNPNAFLAEVDRNSLDIETDMQGSKAVFAVQLGVSQAVGARAELGTLPGAQRTLVRQATANLKYLYGVIRLTGPFIESAKTNAQSFERGLRVEVDGIKLSMRLDLNRQVWGDGTGLLANFKVNTSTRVLNLADGANMQYFQVGMLIDLKDNAGADISNGNSREIIAMDVAAKQITLDVAGGDVTTAVTDGAYREDARNNELTGLDAIVDSSGTLFNIDPTTAGNERWVSTEKGTWGAFSLDKFQEVIDAVHDESGEWITHIFSQGTERRLYLQQLTADRRFAVQENPKKLNAGFKGLAYTGGGDVDAVWVKDPYVNGTQRIYGLTMRGREGEPIMQFRKQKEFEFMDVNGSTLLPDIYGTTGVDAYKAVLCTYAEIICTKRNAHFKLTGVTG